MRTTARELTVRVVSPGELSEDELAAWTRWHWNDPVLSSPYFHPGFTRALAAVRSDVRVAVLEDGAGAAGFFPFQGGRLGFARPAGGRLSDFHGVIARPGVTFSAERLLAECGLAAWDFTHLPASQTAFARHLQRIEDSRYVDLRAGYEGYLEERRVAGSTTVKQSMRKMRKIEREVGPLRFDPQVSDASLLETLCAWKSRQYRATGVADVFAYPWTVALLRQLHCVGTAEFAGRLSALYAGGRLIALHFGMQSRRVLHYWFPVYDPAWGKYSPGLILLLEIARAAAEQGLERIDLGKGEEEFKQSLGSGSIPVASGAVETGHWLRRARRCWRNTRRWLKTSPAGAPARMTARLIRPLRDWMSFR